MRRKSRRLAGILALMALGLSSAEMVLASTCPPAMDATPAGITGDDGLHDAPTTAAPKSGHNPDHESDDEPCPFGPAVMASGCVAAASLPSRAGAVPPTPSADRATVFAHEDGDDLLLGTPLFRPPRA